METKSPPASIALDGKTQLVEKSGTLAKEGSVVKSWKKRFFRLSDCALMYYENTKESSIKGIFLLRDSVCAVSRRTDKPHMLEVVHPRRTLYCAADSASDLAAWIAAINNNISYQANMNLIFQRQIVELKTMVEAARKDAEEKTRAFEELRVKSELAKISTPTEQKTSQDRELDSLRTQNETLRKELKDAQGASGDLRIRLTAAETSATAAIAAAAAGASSSSSSSSSSSLSVPGAGAGHARTPSTGPGAAATAAAAALSASTPPLNAAEMDLLRSLQEELSQTKAALAKAKKERTILKQEVRRLAGGAAGAGAD